MDLIFSKLPLFFSLFIISFWGQFLNISEWPSYSITYIRKYVHHTLGPSELCALPLGVAGRRFLSLSLSPIVDVETSDPKRRAQSEVRTPIGAIRNCGIDKSQPN